MANHDDAPTPQVPAPDPALRRLDPLVGTWTIQGRTLGAEQDDVTGTVTIEWLPGGFFLQLRGDLRVESMEVQSLELVYHDPSTGAFASNVYSNVDGGEPARYGWDVQGKVVTHWTAGSKYTGTFSEDGSVLSGGWRPDDGTQTEPGNAYDVVMTRVDEG